MKNSKIKYALLLMLSTAITLAQPNPDPNSNDPDPTDAPLDQNLVWLLVFGLILAFACYKKYAQLQQVK